MDLTLLAASYIRSAKRTDLYTQLYQYLLQHKELNVPGIGTFLFTRNSANSDFASKKIYPPAYTIALDPNGNFNSRKFFNWLGIVLNISERDAVVHFNDFAFDLKRKIGNGDTITWSGVGQLSRGLGGDIKFEPAPVVLDESPVIAEKVLRHKADHMVRVGEDEKTSDQMREFFTEPEKSRSYWWALAMVAIILAVIFIGWYLSENGFGIGNNQKLNAKEAPASYKLLP